MRFEGKHILVTGAASGIGRATALLFAREGAILAIADINREGLAETAELMMGSPQILPYDAADYASCRDIVAQAASDRLDILCNVSGMLKWGRSEEFSPEDFDRVMRVNASSVFVMCQAALPHLIRSKGNIVNMASTASLAGLAYSIAYSASKHAVAAITKGLAIEFAAQGVRVNGVCPGQVRTPMTNGTMPEGDYDFSLIMRNAPKLDDGVCEPEDIAEAVAWLASDAARKVTGTLLTVDGGQMAG